MCPPIIWPKVYQSKVAEDLFSTGDHVRIDSRAGKPLQSFLEPFVATSICGSVRCLEQVMSPKPKHLGNLSIVVDGMHDLADAVDQNVAIKDRNHALT